ncbi:hypothetical protein INT45_003064 [Circinella minor]|uniref:Zn(2)-C6 fungal-type domain-containing protein n=1 Tax=Circinella minor TaxID=1195481 RepID=A0A8H7RZL5_9FUNG|nr:hypothetical protein INT45_003064 [Circinella minor]
MEESILPSQHTLPTQPVLQLNTASITTPSHSSSKVERNSKSCDNCRKRKVRCNANIQIPCAFCLKNKIECQFLSNRKKLGPPSKRYTKSLETRVQLLEKLLDEERKKNQTRNHVIQLQPEVFNNSLSLYSDTTLELQRQGTGLLPDIFLPPQLTSSSLSMIRPQQHITLIENPYLRYLHLVQEIPGLTLELLECMIESFFHFANFGDQVISKYDFLLEFYYQYPQPLDKYLFLAISAVGCHFLSSQPHMTNQVSTISAARRYLWKKAMEGAMEQSYTRPSISTIQTLMLLGVLAPGSKGVGGKSTNWLILGAAIRMCQDMGLFYEANIQHLSKREIQLRRRIAYSIYIQDKFFSATCGKPFTIRDDDFNVELPLIHEVEPDNGFILKSITKGRLPKLLEQAERVIYEKSPVYSALLELISVAHAIRSILVSFYMPKIISNTDIDVDTPLMEWQARIDANVSSRDIELYRLLYSGALLLRYRPVIKERSSEENCDELQLLNLCTLAANNIVDALDTLPIPPVPSMTDGLISLATEMFVHNCNRMDENVRLQARKNLRRCINIYTRNEIAIPLQNIELVRQIQEVDPGNNIS